MGVKLSPGFSPFRTRGREGATGLWLAFMWSLRRKSKCWRLLACQELFPKVLSSDSQTRTARCTLTFPKVIWHKVSISRNSKATMFQRQSGPLPHDESACFPIYSSVLMKCEFSLQNKKNTLFSSSEEKRVRRCWFLCSCSQYQSTGNGSSHSKVTVQSLGPQQDFPQSTSHMGLPHQSLLLWSSSWTETAEHPGVSTLRSGRQLRKN
jgi:hypothetical protein